MDITNENRQQKFRDRMKESGKKQRVFFLSDEAMDALKKRKSDTQAPSLNHALESLLISLGTDIKVVEVPANFSSREQEILDAARRLHQLSFEFRNTPEGEKETRARLQENYWAITKEIAELAG